MQWAILEKFDTDHKTVVYSCSVTPDALGKVHTSSCITQW